MRIELTNDFHNTTCSLNCKNVFVYDDVAVVHLTLGQITRAKQELCGYSDCTCSGDAGTRGRQETPEGKRIEIDCGAAYTTRRAVQAKRLTKASR